MTIGWPCEHSSSVGTSAGLLAPYIMGSVIENARTPVEGYNAGYGICGLVMLVGGIIAMILVRPERDGARLTRADALAPAAAAE